MAPTWCSITAILPIRSAGTARAHEERAAKVAEIGESFLTYFEPEDLRTRLLALGFSEIEDLGPRQIAARYFPNRVINLPDRGGHVIRATKI